MQADEWVVVGRCSVVEAIAGVAVVGWLVMGVKKCFYFFSFIYLFIYFLMEVTCYPRLLGYSGRLEQIQVKVEII